MERKYIAEFSNEGTVAQVFMVKEIEIKLAKNGKQYMHLLLGDKTGEITGRKWEVSEVEAAAAKNCEQGRLLFVTGAIKEWQGGKQLNVTKLQPVPEDMPVDTHDFIKASPEKSEDMYEYIMTTIASFEDEELRKLCEKIWEERKEKLLYYPAASKNHHAEMGGLLYHMKTMSMAGERLCQVYTHLNRDLLLTGVFLHDIEKLTEINSNQYGIADGYSFEGQLLGHIIQGIMLLDKEMAELGFSKEKKVMVEHMILSHHYEPEFGSPKKPLFPEAEILHYLDIIDARMYDMSHALKDTEEGGFSDRVFTLDNRRLYKPTNE